MDRDSNASIIVELLDMDEDCPDFEVAELIFRDYAQVRFAPLSFRKAACFPGDVHSSCKPYESLVRERKTRTWF